MNKMLIRYYYKQRFNKHLKHYPPVEKFHGRIFKLLIFKSSVYLSTLKKKIMHFFIYYVW